MKTQGHTEAELPDPATPETECTAAVLKLGIYVAIKVVSG